MTFVKLLFSTVLLLASLADLTRAALADDQCLSVVVQVCTNCFTLLVRRRVLQAVFSSVLCLSSFSTHIFQLAKHDRLLSQNLEVAEDDRVGRKKLVATEAATVDAWVETLTSEKNNKGTIFSCGYSSAWVGEVFTGLEAQFPEYQNYFPDLPAAVEAASDGYAYVDATGDKLLPLFEANSDVGDKRVIYRFKHTGMIDHVWLVEQLPNDAGFRVYQSYNGAYSLHAWLSTNVDGMYGPDDEGYDLVDFERVRASFNGVVGMMCNNTVTSLEDAEMISTTTCPDMAVIGPIDIVKEWAVYVQNYDEAEMTANFKKSWDLYGKGMTISPDDFKAGYLADLGQLSASIKTASADPSVEWSEEMHALWLELFASPSPMNWPGIPFASFPASTGLQGYQLEVSIVQAEGGTDATGTCCKNAQILADAIPSEAVVIECGTEPLGEEGGANGSAGNATSTGSTGGTTTSGAGRVYYSGWLSYGLVVTAVFGMTASFA